jgi:cation-transporting ATPase E
MATALTGLSAADVEERRAAGKVNHPPESPNRTIAQIIRANVLTPVNFIIGTLFVLILVAGHPGDALFAGVIISNSVIGIVQELRTRKALARLEVLNAPEANVVRDGVEHTVDLHDVVLDDVLRLGPGDQAVVDGEVVATDGLEMDESLLTGESESVAKIEGDPIMSGSFVTSGTGWMVATRVGGDSHAARLASEARQFKLVHSELRNGINQILRVLICVVPPVALLVLWSLLESEDQWQEALRGTVAAAVAMIPDGLVLLTSLAFIAGILAIARRKALAKELATVELLARVDTLCLDKTGTITTGRIVFVAADPQDGYDQAAVDAALGAMAAADPSPNATLLAVGERHADPGWARRDRIPFNSSRKWAATAFDGHDSWYLGAPEILLAGCRHHGAGHAVNEAAERGERVILLAHSPSGQLGEDLPGDLRPAAVVRLEDEVRPDAEEILAFFLAQDVTLRVISGDNPVTVAAVARRAGVPQSAVGYDARALPEGDGLATVLDEHRVFGRVQPHQKRDMVESLQSSGRVVAMTGDGVNDVLALKLADMGIAMGSGSAAARAVADLTLLDNRFATLPHVLAEGRRVIANIERVANLFIVKATYAVLLAAATAVLREPYPFLPRQLTLLGSFSIGVPGFFLALAAAAGRSPPGFVGRVLHFAVPSGTVAAIVTFGAYTSFRSIESLTLEQARSAATVTLLIVGLSVLARVAVPLKPWKVALVAGMAAGYVVVLAVPFLRDYFELETLGAEWWGLLWLWAGPGALAIWVGPGRIPYWTAPRYHDDTEDDDARDEGDTVEDPHPPQRAGA